MLSIIWSLCLQGKKYHWASPEPLPKISRRHKSLLWQSYHWRSKLCFFKYLNPLISFHNVGLLDNYLVLFTSFCRYGELACLLVSSSQTISLLMIHSLLNGASSFFLLLTPLSFLTPVILKYKSSHETVTSRLTAITQDNDMKISIKSAWPHLISGFCQIFFTLSNYTMLLTVGVGALQGWGHILEQSARSMEW